MFGFVVIAIILWLLVVALTLFLTKSLICTLTVGLIFLGILIVIAGLTMAVSEVMTCILMTTG